MCEERPCIFIKEELRAPLPAYEIILWKLLIYPFKEISQFWGNTPGVFANQSSSPETSGVIFAMENKFNQISENTLSVGDTYSPAPRMQVVPAVQEVEVT